jgi:FixJ family two-component response regulator
MRTAVEAMLAGAVDFIEKPFTGATVLKHVRRLTIRGAMRVPEARILDMSGPRARRRKAVGGIGDSPRRT